MGWEGLIKKLIYQVLMGNWSLIIIWYTHLILILLTNLATQMSWISIIQQFWGLLEVKEARSSPFFFSFLFLIKKLIINFKYMGPIFIGDPRQWPKCFSRASPGRLKLVRWFWIMCLFLLSGIIYILNLGFNF